MITLTPSQAQILYALGRYKFLTAYQLDDLGITKGADYSRRLLRELRNKEFVAYTTGTVGNSVRPFQLYYLTAKGAEVIANGQKDIRIEDIKYPKSRTAMIKNDFAHRLSTISVKIAFDKWAEKNGYDCDIWDTYFDTLGSQRNSDKGGYLKPVTRIDTEMIFEDKKRFVDLDSVFIFNTRTNQHLCMLEVHNGNDTKKIVSKIIKLAHVINNGECSAKYNSKKNAKSLNVFENASTITAVIKRLDSEPIFQSAISNYFYFVLAKEVHKNFNTWVKITGEVVDFSVL